MRAGQAFLAGTVALGLCLALASRAAAKPFNLSGAVLNETIDTISGIGAVDCPDYPAASDSYVWTANLTNVNKFLKNVFSGQTAIVAFFNSCNLTSALATNTLQIPPGSFTIQTNKSSGVVTISFSGALPDFNTYNTAAGISFFDYMTFQLQYNPATNKGTLQVSGNANLCDSLAAGPPQCLLLDTVSGYDCACDSIPIQNTLDITSLFE